MIKLSQRNRENINRNTFSSQKTLANSLIWKYELPLRKDVQLYVNKNIQYSVT
jgi:hypothetical protein